MTEPPASMTYASVVSRESVRIALTMAALHDLEVKAADIENAYLSAPCREKIAVRKCGKEFGPNAGRRAILVRALYGLKSSGNAFRSHLADCMRELGFKPCKADADVWMRPETRPSDGFEYYSYVLLYVDDILCVHHDAMSVLKKIGKFFPMKEGSVGDPELYLGAKLRQTKMPNGVVCWMQSPAQYIKEAVKNVETHLDEKYGTKLLKKAPAPFPRDYDPLLDVTDELDSEDANYYQSQIGVLRWMVELGRIDIITEVSLLASHLALPRKGHMEAVFHIYAYLKKHHAYVLALDPTYPEIDRSSFKLDADWSGMYEGTKEPIPENMPEPRGKELVLRLFKDSDHAGDKLTRKSRTGFIIYGNNAPLFWLSRKQATTEGSVFGAEFVALKQGLEEVRAFRYKLRMMGIPIIDPCWVYGDNMSVVNNVSRPESVLKKKSHSICYHYARESTVMGESVMCHIRTEDNPADICTKVVPGGMKRTRIVGNILYNTDGDDTLKTWKEEGESG